MSRVWYAPADPSLAADIQRRPERPLLPRGRRSSAAMSWTTAPCRRKCILNFEGDVDEIVRRAQTVAATIVTEPAQQPWDYTGAFGDPDG